VRAIWIPARTRRNTIIGQQEKEEKEEVVE
jgi:hypothetical protein